MNSNFLNGFVDELVKEAAYLAISNSPKLERRVQGIMRKEATKLTAEGAALKKKYGTPANAMRGMKAESKTKMDTVISGMNAKKHGGSAQASKMGNKIMAPSFAASGAPAKKAKAAPERTTAWQRHLRKAKKQGGEAFAAAKAGKADFLSKNKGAQHYSKPGVPTAPAGKSSGGAQKKAPVSAPPPGAPKPTLGDTKMLARSKGAVGDVSKTKAAPSASQNFGSNMGMPGKQVQQGGAKTIAQSGGPAKLAPGVAGIARFKNKMKSQPGYRGAATSSPAAQPAAKPVGDPIKKLDAFKSKAKAFGANPALAKFKQMQNSWKG